MLRKISEIKNVYGLLYVGLKSTSVCAFTVPLYPRLSTYAAGSYIQQAGIRRKVSYISLWMSHLEEISIPTHNQCKYAALVNPSV